MKTDRGSVYDCPLPDSFNVIYKGELLKRILAMEKKKPISLENAIIMIREDVAACYKDKRFLEGNWNLSNFIQWISSKGYHVDLTGTEYEIVQEEASPVTFHNRTPLPNEKNILKWKPFKTVDKNGFESDDQMPEVIDKRYKGTLLAKILSMPRQSPIAFEDAARLAGQKADAAFSGKKFGSGPGDYDWYMNNFVEFIATLGYHIELTGDEFELYGDFKDNMM